MSNGYFNSSAIPGFRDTLTSEVIRDQFGALAAAFDLLPPPAGGGSLGFNGGTWIDGLLQACTLVGCNLGASTSPSRGYVSYLGFPRTTTVTLGAGNRGLTRTVAGDLQVQDNATAIFMWDNAGNTVVGDGATELPTSAAAKFLYIPTVNGAPSGSPTVKTGSVPIVFDRDNEEICVYTGGAWKSVGVS